MYFGLGMLAGSVIANRLSVEKGQRELADSRERLAASEREYYSRDAIDVEARVVEEVLLLPK